MPGLNNEQETDRLTESEVAALKERLGGISDVRAHGAATVGDLSEATGIPTDRVRVALSAIRSERAFSPAKTTGVSQTTLAVLAAVMFLVAGWIFYANWPVDPDARADAIRKELLDRRARRLREHPPFPYKVTVHEAPNGFGLSVIGDQCSAVADSKGSPLAMPRDAAQARLAKCLRELVQTVQDNDAKAPHDGKSPVVRETALMQRLPGSLSVIYNVTGTGGMSYVPIAPTQELPADKLSDARERAIDGLAGQIVDAMEKSQQDHLRYEGKLDEAGWFYPAPGFSVSVTGRQSFQSASPAGLVPIDSGAVEKRMVRILHALVDKCRTPVTGLPMAVTNDLKLPPLRFVKVSIRGPYDTAQFDVPVGPSPQYATAADAIRGADRIIAEKAAEAAKQIDRLNRENMSSR